MASESSQNDDETSLPDGFHLLKRQLTVSNLRLSPSKFNFPPRNRRLASSDFGNIRCGNSLFGEGDFARRVVSDPLPRSTTPDMPGLITNNQHRLESQGIGPQGKGFRTTPLENSSSKSLEVRISIGIIRIQ